MKTLMILNEAPCRGRERSMETSDGRAALGSGSFCAEPVTQIAPDQPSTTLHLGSRPK